MSEFMGKDPELELMYDKTDEELLEMAEKAYEDKKTELPVDQEQTNDSYDIDDPESQPDDNTDILENYDILTDEKKKRKSHFTAPGDRIIIGIACGIIVGAFIGFLSVKPVYFIVGGIIAGLITGSILDIRCRNDKKDNIK